MIERFDYAHSPSSAVAIPPSSKCEVKPWLIWGSPIFFGYALLPFYIEEIQASKSFREAINAIVSPETLTHNWQNALWASFPMVIGNFYFLLRALCTNNPLRCEENHWMARKIFKMAYLAGALPLGLCLFVGEWGLSHFALPFLYGPSVLSMMGATVFQFFFPEWRLQRFGGFIPNRFPRSELLPPFLREKLLPKCSSGR